jgi:hypothetical protein
MTMKYIKAVHSKSNERKFAIQCVMDKYVESNDTIGARHPKLFKDDTPPFEQGIQNCSKMILTSLRQVRNWLCACLLTSLMG